MGGDQPSVVRAGVLAGANVSRLAVGLGVTCSGGKELRSNAGDGK